MISSSSHSSTSSGANVQTKIPFQGPVVNRSLSPQSTKYSYLSELGNDNEKSRLQAFKARRLEQKQADKEKLAQEFPLLFSNTFGSPSLRKKERAENSFPYFSADSENIDSNLAHLNSTDGYYLNIETKPLQSNSTEKLSSISAIAMTKGKKKHRRRGSNEKLNIVMAATAAASIVTTADSSAAVEALGPAVEDKDVSKKTLRNRKKRSMKKQRLQKKQQQAKAGGPELTEAEVRVNANILFVESEGCEGEDDGVEDDLEGTNDMNDSASVQASGLAGGHNCSVTPEDVDLTSADGTDSPTVPSAHDAVVVDTENDSTMANPASPAPSPESESSDLTSVEPVTAELENGSKSEAGQVGDEQTKLDSLESVRQVGTEIQLETQVVVEDEVVLRELERERVQDVLDYMLFETKELDVPTHKRLSADCFAFHEIYALQSPTSATNSTSSSSAMATSSSSAQATTINPNGKLGRQPAKGLENTSNMSAGGPVGELDVLAALRAYLQKSNQLNGVVEGEDPNLSPLLQQGNLPQRRRRTNRRKNLTLTEADLTQVSSLSMDECHPNPKCSDKSSRRTCLELVPEEKAEVDLPQIYPMSQLLDLALGKGAVQARVTGWLKQHDEVKYIVQMQIEQDGCETKMALLKTYADFKLFHQRLTDALGPSSMDAMCANLIGRSQAAGGDHIIPPLPSKEVLRIAEGRVIEEGGQQFLRARERYLDRWLKTIMLTQHNRNILQMKKLRQQIKIFIML